MRSIFELTAVATGWPFYQHVIFDCDSTLSRIEGIDMLASEGETQKKIIELTDAAMSGAAALAEVYGKRLELICPTRQSVRELARLYFQDAIPGAKETVCALRELGCEVYIVSGGLLEPVKEFGIALGVDAGNIRAVEVEYDQLAGQWWVSESGSADQSYLTYRHSELSESNGKAAIIAELLAGKEGASMLIGDGVSDLLARNAVDLFVGYAGVAKRDRVVSEAPLYFENDSLLPVLAMAAGSREFFRLDASLRNACLACIRSQPPVFNRQILARNFLGSFL